MKWCRHFTFYVDEYGIAAGLLKRLFGNWWDWKFCPLCGKKRPKVGK